MNINEQLWMEIVDKINWDEISYNKTLSEDFIRVFKDNVDWSLISSEQQLSEDFIREFKDYVFWSLISSEQQLSEDFIREFKDYLDWYYISSNQTLSEDFTQEFRERLSEFNWKYATKEQKMKSIKSCGLYEIDGDYIYAYKLTKKDGISVFDPSYKYEVGEIYESDCNCDITNEKSFGLSAWTKDEALNYYSDGELYKVKIHINDLGAFIKGSGKLRCFKLEIVEKITERD